MRSIILVGALLALFSSAAFPQAKVPLTRSQTCDQATQAYEAAALANKAEATQRAKSRVLKECFPVKARSPTLQKPVSVGSTFRPIEPVRATPIARTHVTAPSPALLNSCDAGGCWDSQGKRYNGTDTSLIGPAGSACVRSGERVECR
jgi:hypothetical protein